MSAQYYISDREGQNYLHSFGLSNNARYDDIMKILIFLTLDYLMRSSRYCLMSNISASISRRNALLES